MTAGAAAPPGRGSEGRDETELERADRNWDELLGELRVTQTGVAILFSVLLTVPFSARFDDVDAFQRALYTTALVLSAATTVTLIAPVSCHRLLFRKGRKEPLVLLSNRLAVAGLALLCLTLGAVLLLVTDVVLDRVTAVVLSAVFTLGTALLWGVPALRERRAG
jgi:hypothetical protein